MEDDDKIEFLKFNYDKVQEMINFADSKANICISLQSLFLSIGLGSFLLSNTFSNLNVIDNTVKFGFIFLIVYFIISSGWGIFCTIKIYQARYTPINDKKYYKKFFFFRSIANYLEFDEYYDNNIYNLSKGEVVRELSREIYQISNIAKIKMDKVNISIIYLVLNLFTTIILLAYNAMIFMIINKGG